MLSGFDHFVKGEPLENVVDKRAGYSTTVTLKRVREAAERIRGIAKRTQLMTSRKSPTGQVKRANFKCENFQRGGAFKIRERRTSCSRLRGATTPAGWSHPRSGNHAQAVAIAAEKVGTRSILVMPTDAPRSKVAATRAHGAEIVNYNRLREDREAIGARIASETGATLVPPYDHAWTMAGQGTAALEFLEEIPDLDALVVCIGGGGLLAGSATVANALNPSMRVFGVEPERANDTYLLLPVRRAGGDRPARHHRGRPTVAEAGRADVSRHSAPGRGRGAGHGRRDPSNGPIPAGTAEDLSGAERRRCGRGRAVSQVACGPRPVGIILRQATWMPTPAILSESDPAARTASGSAMPAKAAYSTFRPVPAEASGRRAHRTGTPGQSFCGGAPGTAIRRIPSRA